VVADKKTRNAAVARCFISLPRLHGIVVAVSLYAVSFFCSICIKNAENVLHGLSQRLAFIGLDLVVGEPAT
jgi:hypothetical protein